MLRRTRAGSSTPAPMSARAHADERECRRREEAAEPDRAEQEALEHAEHAPQHLVRDGALHDRERVDVDERVAEPDHPERDERSGNGRGRPQEHERDAEEHDAEAEVGSEPAPRREDERHEASDEAARSEGGVEVADSPSPTSSSSSA